MYVCMYVCVCVCVVFLFFVFMTKAIAGHRRVTSLTHFL